MGSIITASVASFRSRKQPIVFSVDTYALYGEDELDDDVGIKISITEGDQVFHFDNMHVVHIHFNNKGGLDREALTVGVTLPQGHRIIRSANGTPSRHHLVSKQGEFSPASPVSEVDFVLAPFNRADQYGITLYVIDDSDGAFEVGSVELSSPQAVRFVKAANWSDRFTGVATVLSLGPLKLSVGLD